jgi:hypothetical protein
VASARKIFYNIGPWSPFTVIFTNFLRTDFCAVFSTGATGGGGGRDGHGGGWT